MKRRVLVVEDDQAVRDTLAMVLEIEGYEVETAVNGKEALERLMTHDPPHVILTDIMMPVMDGWTFLREKQLIPALSKIPAIVLSASENRRAPDQIQVTAFLPKPMNIDTIAELVSRSVAA